MAPSTTPPMPSSKSSNKSVIVPTDEYIKYAYVAKSVPSCSHDKMTFYLDSKEDLGKRCRKPWTIHLQSPLRIKDWAYERKLKTENGAGPSKRRRIVTKTSMKVSCKAKTNVHLLTNGKFKVDYYWAHINHDPTDLTEVTPSFLDNDGQPAQRPSSAKRTSSSAMLSTTSMKTLLRSLGLPEYIHGDDTSSLATSISFKEPIKTEDALPRLVPEDFEDWGFNNDSSNDVYNDSLEHEGAGAGHVERNDPDDTEQDKFGPLNQISPSTELPGIQQYIDSTFTAFDPLTNFYGQMNIQGLDFLNYQGRQQMNHELVNILVNGGQKYQTSPGSQERLDNVGPQRRRSKVTVVDEPIPLPKTRKRKKASPAHDSSKVPVGGIWCCNIWSKASPRDWWTSAENYRKKPTRMEDWY
ncbi:hypothetical protein BC941DRAFT_471921 [Chlamydoabsidia padenii]|nr:hypothetical protein BC941DRAFT_471921 [Chlamydoabsidia padenii]